MNAKYYRRLWEEVEPLLPAEGGYQVVVLTGEAGDTTIEVLAWPFGKKPLGEVSYSRQVAILREMQDQGIDPYEPRESPWWGLRGYYCTAGGPTKYYFE